ncbi:CusA/CzcA family heavy metal efflux RND transporter [Cyclobacterium plantarum]|uniref:CusA/CzcA family heavy metal efflux RND transporter n=1 Tax=Cyclobacterium plantarum TaxID=2716263 RepID=UPI003F72D6A1
MIDKIIAFSVRNKFIIGLLTLVLIVAGIWSMTKVPIDAVPDITNNQVQVITQAPNLGTEDIEQFVTYPVEVAMSNLPGVTEIRSVSRFGLSVVTIVFEDDMGTYLPRQLVNEKLQEIEGEIPEGFGDPSMGPISTGLGEIYQYTLQVDESYEGQYSATDLRTMQDWIVRRQMAMVSGVVEVNGFGGKIKQYEVAVDPDELRAIDLTITDVFEALQLNNQNTGGAYIEKDHYANFIRGEGLARSLEDLQHIVVKTVDGIPIRIKDVAKVQFGNAVRYGAFTKDGKGEAVGGMTLMLKGANSNEVIENVKERVALIQESLPEGVTIEPFLDRSELISKTTSTVTSNLLEGALIVIFVLVFLLGNWRGGLIVASTIPLALLFAFILMHVLGVWANLMSLGAIDFGIIVDGAVIIVEGTVFFLVQRMGTGKKRITQQERDESTIKASSKMMNAAFFGQLIILIVFLPILFLEGVEGKMFQPMALTFMFAMIGAMILCLTYVPMVSSLFIRVKPEEKKSWGDYIVIWLEEKYERALGSTLRKAGLVIGSAVVLLILAIFTFSRMGGEFIPQLDEGNIAFHIILKPGSSLSESIKTSTRIENIILEEFPEVEHAMSRFGVSEVPTDPMPMDLGDCILILKPKDQWVSAETKEELIAKIKEAISIVPGVNYEFTQPIEMRFNELLTGVREDIAIKLYGEDLQVLADKAGEMGKIISTVEGVADMRVEATSGLPQMTVKYNRADLAQYGLNINDVNQVIQSAFAGGKAGVIFEGEKRFDLVVRLDSAHRSSIDDLKNLYVNTPSGAQIPLNEVANVSYEPGPMQISRDNTNRRTYVGVNVRGRDVKSLVEEIQQKLKDQLDLPAGYYIRYGGAFENLERATNRLQVVVPLAMALIFIIIFFALQSFKQSIMIYMAIPLAAIGGIFALWLRDMPFSISAGVGFIVLFGVAVLNGLVLISGWNELKEEGEMDLNKRIRRGAKRRVRPILLTALTDILGFLPMAISVSAGAEVQQPLATVVIGGMITSTLLTLFILPILYRWTEKRSLKPSGAGIATVVVMLGFTVFGPTSVSAQNAEELPKISLEEALSRAFSSYPKLQAAKLEVEQQEELKKTAWDLGKTQIFSAGEEIDAEGMGVYTTIGVQQQQMDIFAIAPKLKVRNRQVALAEAALNLSELELQQQVKEAYANAWIARQNYQLYQRLDSIYQNFLRGVRLRYEVEETSKLAFLAASNQVKQMTLQKEQTAFDYQTSLYRLNLWMVSDSLFTVVDSLPQNWTNQILPPDSLSSHPRLSMATQQVKVANAERKAANADFLPKLNAQYGIQEISGHSGFYQYQVGLTIPLFFMKEQGRTQASRIRQEIAEQNLRQTQFELKTGYLSLLQDYEKWHASWLFYEQEALPLAREQREGAILAYEEGDIDYVSFIQNLKESLQMEIKAREALQEYLQARFQLEYYLNASNL